MKKFCFLFVFAVWNNTPDPYAFTLKTNDGSLIRISSFAGKKILVVNTASNSKYAGQYDSLNILAQQFKGSLVVLAIPSNSFDNEPLENAAISSKLKSDHPNFTICSKDVVVGAGQDSLFMWITRKDLNGMADCVIKADFQKFLIDEHGQLVGIFSSSVSPLSSVMTQAIQNTYQ